MSDWHMSHSPVSDWRRDPIAALALLDPPDRDALLERLTAAQKLELSERWSAWAHEGQAPDESDWRVWLILAGRGFGKTRAGAEWVSGLARADGNLRIALVGATAEDVRKVMIEGESGLLAVARSDEQPVWMPGAREIHFLSGARGFAYSAASPEKLRGPQHDHAWCDEIVKWRHGATVWHNLQFGMRLNAQARVMATTTPRPDPLLRAIIDTPGTIVRGGASALNHNLPKSFLAAMHAQYAGTRLGRQELGGELIEEAEGALWSRDLIEARRVRAAPELARVVIGVDPPASSQGDACGIVAVGRGADGLAYVLQDASVEKASPEAWARAVAACAARHAAERVVAEANNGGEMVGAVLQAADIALPVRLVHASRGKSARAEPVAALYEHGRAFHAGAFPELEDQLCGMMAAGGYDGPGRSPDRADALVWAMTEAMLGKRVAPRVRGM